MASAWRTSSLMDRAVLLDPFLDDLCRPIVMVLVEVLEQARPGRLPSEQFPGDDGRGGAVQGDEVAQVAEMLDGVGGATPTPWERRDAGPSPRRSRGTGRPRRRPRGGPSRRERTRRPGAPGGRRRSGAPPASGWLPSPTYPDTPLWRAMPTKVATNPWSPSPWTVGGKRSTDERTPTPRKDSVSRAVAARSPAGLARISAPGTSPSSSVATRPGRQPEHARGQHQGPVGVGQGRPHGLHGPTVGGRRGGEVAAEGHLVLERQVDHPIGVGGRLGQAVGVVDVAPLDEWRPPLPVAAPMPRSGPGRPPRGRHRAARERRPSRSSLMRR